MVEITLLTMPDCKLCNHAKAVLERVVKDYELAIEELASQSAQGKQMMIEHRIAFLPGVFIDGRLFSYGRLSERKLRRKLERSGCAIR